MKSSRWNPSFTLIELCVFAGVLHGLLKWFLVRHDIVSSIMAAGNDVPIWMLATAGIFAATRLFVILLVPGLIIAKAVYILMQRFATHP